MEQKNTFTKKLKGLDIQWLGLPSAVKEIPDFSTMIIVSFLALLANGLCLFVLQKSKNMKGN